MDNVLYFAVEHKNFHLAKRLLEEERSDPNVVCPDSGISAVHLAVGLAGCASGDKFLELLLDHNGDPNCNSFDGATPVHIAAAWGKKEELDMLLSRGGDPMIKDKEGQTALDYAKNENQEEVFLQLKSYQGSFYPEIKEEKKYTYELERVEVCDKVSPFNLESCTDQQEIWNEPCPTLPSAENQFEKVSSWCQKHCYNALSKAPASVCSRDSSEFVTCLSHISTVQSSALSEVYKYRDESQDVTLFEKRLPPAGSAVNGELDLNMDIDFICEKLGGSSTSLTSVDSDGYSTDTLRNELTALGHSPGPITKSTKKVYIRRLFRLRKVEKLADLQIVDSDRQKFSRELEKSIRTYPSANFLQPAADLERVMAEEFASPVGKGRRWREGHSKVSFTYLLLDPRTSQNLPARSPMLSPSEQWLDFLRSVFYVGKGCRSRPYAHLYNAVDHWSGKNSGSRSANVDRILNIWAGDKGVVCLHLFHSTIPVEAYTREAAMIEAIGLNNLTNAKVGNFYGKVASRPPDERRLLGVHLLHKAMQIFLLEGERQLRPNDVS